MPDDNVINSNQAYISVEEDFLGTFSRKSGKEDGKELDKNKQVEQVSQFL